MKRIISIQIAILLFISYVNSQEAFHLTQDIGVLDSPTSTSRMTQRIIKDATQYRLYGPVPRFVQYDFAFAADINEYKKLDGFGILYISSLNRDSTEYPIVRTYFKTKDGLIDLKLIGSIEMPVADSLVKTIFSHHRIDYYYYLPYEMTQTSGSLLIDWKNNRKEFILTKFPNDFKLDYMKDIKLKLPDTGSSIDPKSFYEFADREFEIKLNR